MYTECCALYAKSTAFCLANSSDKILLVPERIIHADLPLPHLINVLCSKIAKPRKPTVRKSDSPDTGDLEAVARRANRLSFGRGAPARMLPWRAGGRSRGEPRPGRPVGQGKVPKALRREDQRGGSLCGLGFASCAKASKGSQEIGKAFALYENVQAQSL
jgi:hypothetical protein